MSWLWGLLFDVWRAEVCPVCGKHGAWFKPTSRPFAIHLCDCLDRWPDDVTVIVRRRFRLWRWVRRAWLSLYKEEPVPRILIFYTIFVILALSVCLIFATFANAADCPTAPGVYDPRIDGTVLR